MKPAFLTVRKTLLLLCIICVLAILPLAAAAKPNIIVILADDMGYGDMQCNLDSQLRAQHPEVVTPNIDSLAASGVRCTDAHTCGVTCAPSRAGLLTGRYSQRFGIYGAEDSRGGMNESERTMADLLKQQNYATGVFGKWHLGYTIQFNPRNRGFDEFYGFLGHGAHSYWNLDNSGVEFANLLSDGYSAQSDTGYLTDRITERSIDFIKRNTTRPFFLYVPYNAVHTPLENPLSGPHALGIGPETRDTLMAMLRQMDDGVGAILKALDDNNLRENTLIVFYGDNGGAAATDAFNGPLRGFKQMTWEGGHRVPCIFSWPGHFSSGTVLNESIIIMDILPTVAAAAEMTLPGDRVYDGVNILPWLSGQNSGPIHECLFWDFGETDQWAVRMGDWKLVTENGIAHLSNLADDIGESTDLSAQNIALVDSMTRLYTAWRAEMPAPVTTTKRGCLDPRYAEYDTTVNRPDEEDCTTLLTVSGCMDEEDPAFNYKATVHDQSQCSGTAAKSLKDRVSAAVLPFKLIVKHGGVQISAKRTARYSVLITDASGRRIFRKSLKGPAFCTLAETVGPKVFLVTVAIDGKKHQQTIINR